MPEEQKYRPTPQRLIVGPVSATYQDVRGAEGNHILDMSGWGRLQYYKDGDQIQDRMTQWIVDAINEKLLKDPI